MKNSEIAEKLQLLVQVTSEVCLKSSMQNPSIQIEKSDFPHLTPGEWMSLILVSTNQFRIIFKIFFDTESVQREVNNVDLSKATELESQNILRDFMSEYCNITGGYIKTVLDKLGIKSGSSLPVTLLGFDDFFFPFANEQNSFERRWCLRGKEKTFYCSCYIVTTETKNLEKIMDFDLNEIQVVEGDMDLL
jgi:hypothetical protein